MMTSPKLQTDDLTGMLTRKAFLDEFEQRLAEARSENTSFSLALVDIDGFKRVNDEFGHVSGDNTIKAIGETLQAALGDGVIYSRYGGDETALLMLTMEREQAFLALERARADVEHLQIAGKGPQATITITISAGVASYPVDGRTQSELMRKADQALYRAKLNGRNQVRLAYEERMVPKTAHFTQTQLERLSSLASEQKTGEAELLREALDDLLAKYGINDIESD